CNNLIELREIAKKSNEELAKVIPSFIRRSDSNHKHQKSFAQFYEAMHSEIKLLTEQYADKAKKSMDAGVRLISYDTEGVQKVAGALLFGMSDRGLQELTELCKNLSEEELNRILDTAVNARENRRQKSPRALEHATFTFEIIGDFGSYRDLHRHRMLTQERQLLSCDYGYYMPPEIIESKLDGEYKKALESAKDAFDKIAKELPEEAQYIVPMAYNVRWYFACNLRTIQWLCELRSSPAGHPSYRLIAQQMAKAVSDTVPQFERFLKFVDYDGYDLGRLDQEQRKAEKQGLA
ncbi:MAG: thyX, partial [Chlamydiia bacterium]|nr:thyX [Chlamydiia bacterium]